MATITSINPFPHDVHTAFKAYMSSTTYYNCKQFTHEKWHYMHTILNNPTTYILYNKESLNLKTRTLSSFCLLIISYISKVIYSIYTLEL
jgi:regulator of sigma D